MQSKSNVIDARADFTARALITKVERKLHKHGDLGRYDVYCEIYDPEPYYYEVWLRDRMDDSRIGPLDLVAMNIVE